MHSHSTRWMRSDVILVITAIITPPPRRLMLLREERSHLKTHNPYPFCRVRIWITKSSTVGKYMSGLYISFISLARVNWWAIDSFFPYKSAVVEFRNFFESYMLGTYVVAFFRWSLGDAGPVLLLAAPGVELREVSSVRISSYPWWTKRRGSHRPIESSSSRLPPRWRLRKCRFPPRESW